MDPKPYRCPLGKYQTDDLKYEKLKQEGWNRDKILIVNITDTRLTWPEKEILIQIGNKLYARG